MMTNRMKILTGHKHFFRFSVWASVYMMRRFICTTLYNEGSWGWRNVKPDAFNEPTEVKFYCLLFHNSRTEAEKASRTGSCCWKGSTGIQAEVCATSRLCWCHWVVQLPGWGAGFTDRAGKGRAAALTDTRDLQRMEGPRGCGGLISAPSFDRGFMHALGHRWPPQLRHSGSFIVFVVRSLSCVWLFATPRAAARQASLSSAISQSWLRFMPNHFICRHPLFLLPSVFPSIRVFSKESALRIRGPKYWSFSFSISLSSEYSGLISFRID